MFVLPYHYLFILFLCVHHKFVLTLLLLNYLKHIDCQKYYGWMRNSGLIDLQTRYIFNYTTLFHNSSMSLFVSNIMIKAWLNHTLSVFTIMRHAADNSDGLKLFRIRNYVAGMFEDNLNMILLYFQMYVIMISKWNLWFWFLL